MATLRQDATTGEWVILAPERATRSNGGEPVRPPLPSFEQTCPFCPGNEDSTPPEISRFPEAGPWEHRVIPNLYPALDGGTFAESDDSMHPAERSAAGAHEVVVESPVHNERLDEMPAGRLAAVLRTWRDRSVGLGQKRGMRSVIVFKNFGERAGISLAHPHSQIIGTPVVPPEDLRRVGVAGRYFEQNGRSLFADLVERELADGARLVGLASGFVAVAPFASRHPYETWIIPREPQASFTLLGDDESLPLATLLGDVVGALRRAAGDPDYNVVVHSPPVGREGVPFLRWYLRILPRMTTAAGFELGSGMWINCVAPEGAAAALRKHLASAVAG